MAGKNNFKVFYKEEFYQLSYVVDYNFLSFVWLVLNFFNNNIKQFVCYYVIDRVIIKECVKGFVEI